MLYFIINKKAQTGNGEKVWPQIKKRLEQEQTAYRAFKTSYKGHALALARKISQQKEKEICLVVLGGDGTLNEVINGITDFDKVRLAMIPCGSGNDFARGMGLSWDVNTCMDAVLHSEREQKVDLGRVRWELEDAQEGESEKKPVRARYFAISSGVGLDALVCKNSATAQCKKTLNRIKMGKFTYLVLTVQSLFSMKTVPGTIDYDHKKEHKEFQKIIFAAAMNQRAEGGGVLMAPGASWQDGTLSMCVAHGITRVKAFLLLPLLVAGKHQKLSCFQIREFHSCELNLSAPVTLHTDGEYCGEVRNLQYICAPGKLRLVDTVIKKLPKQKG